MCIYLLIRCLMCKAGGHLPQKRYSGVLGRVCWMVKLKLSQQTRRHLIRTSSSFTTLHKNQQRVWMEAAVKSCQFGFQVATICYGPLFCRLEQEVCGVLHPDRVEQNHLCDLILPLENYIKQSLNPVRHLLWVRSVSKMKLQSSVLHQSHS